MKAIERHRQIWQGKSDEWLFERLDNELKQKVEEIHRLLAENETLRQFDVSRRYSLSYLDGQEFEQKTEVWAKDQDDALKQLENICPNATYIFISRL